MLRAIPNDWQTRNKRSNNIGETVLFSSETKYETKIDSKGAWKQNF